MRYVTISIMAGADGHSDATNASGALSDNEPNLGYQKWLRVGFFLAFLALSISIHFSWFEEILGNGGASIVRRQSEAYVLILLIPLFWELFAKSGSPSSREELAGREPTSQLAFATWFGVLLGLSVLLSFDTGIPTFIVTLREATAAVFVICLYLAWSRSFFPSSKVWAAGAPTANRTVRRSYYGLMLIIVVMQTPLSLELFGQSVHDRLVDHAETVAAVVLIPMYFDFISRDVGRLRRFLWYAALVSAPIVVRLPVFPAGFDSLIDWTMRVTEAFIAAIAVSLYFDVLRPELSATPFSRPTAPNAEEADYSAPNSSESDRLAVLRLESK